MALIGITNTKMARALLLIDIDQRAMLWGAISPAHQRFPGWDTMQHISLQK